MFEQLPTFFSLEGMQGAFVLQLLVVWSLVWKGIALWHAARIHKKWFIILLIVNTAGILEIVYLLYFSPEPYIKKLKSKKK